MKSRVPLSVALLCLVLGSTARSEPAPHRFSIQFDYRFAGACVASPEARRTLDAVASMYGQLITDDFAAVPAGTVLSVWNESAQKYEEVRLTEPIDDVLAFVFCANWPGTGTKATAAPVGSPWARGSSFERRWVQKPFQPWAVRVNINATSARPWFYDATPDSDDDLPSRTHYDLFQSILHEMGHALGLIRNDSPFVFTDMVKDNMFYGANAMKWNGGKPVPLEDNSSHIRHDFNRGLLRPNLDRYMMHGSDVIQGFRSYPGALDLAMLKDIGYHLDPVQEARIVARSAPGPEDPRKAAYRARHKNPADPELPVGLWYFDDARYLRTAIVGRPLRYMPPAAVPVSHNLVVRGGGVLLPKGSFLIVDHGMHANGGGREVNQYSLVMDVNLPRTGQDYGLYNTSYNNADGNSAEAFIDDRDRIGQGDYSDFKFRSQEWYRVVIAVDIAANERKYYVDGKPVLTQEAGQRDGRHSIGAVGGDSNPLFCLFADGKGDREDMLVRSVVLYSYALSADRAGKLGAAGDPLP